MSDQDYWADVFLTSDVDRRSDEQELLAWERELLADRLGRDDPTTTTCCVCMERRGVSVYSMKCRVCHEAQREEREAA